MTPSTSASVLVAFAIAAACGGQDDSTRDVTHAPPPVLETLPPERGGQDLVGEPFGEPRFDAWTESDADALRPRRGQVTLYRWWTDSCPYCEASLPAVERLRAEFAEDELATVAVYHPKPPRDVDVDDVRVWARERGYDGVVALDRDWSELRRLYLDRGDEPRDRPATSVAILVDREGVIRFIHPGPMFFPSDEERHARYDADYELLRRAIEVLLSDDP